MSQTKMLAGFTVLSLLTMGFGFYETFRNRKNKPTAYDHLRTQEEEISKELQKMNNLQSLLASKAEEIEIKFMKNMPHVLAVQTLKEIIQFTSNIVDRQELEEIILNNRKARRTCFRSMREGLFSEQRMSASLETYYRFVCTFEEQIQYLIEKSQKDFVVFLGIEYTVITDSIDFHTSEGEAGFSEWIHNWSHLIKQQLRELLPLYHQPVSILKIVEIAQHQIEVLMSEGSNLKAAILNLNLQSDDQMESVPTFLETFLEDVIFQEFGIEIQQTNISSEDLTPQLKQKFRMLTELKNRVLEGMMEGEEILDLSQKSYSEVQQAEGQI